MKIQDRAYVAIEYTLTLDSDEVVDQSEPGKPFGFIFGAGQVIPGLENGLEGMKQGQSAKIAVEAEEGYGRTRKELLREIPREQFPADVDIEPNMIFEADGPHGPVRFRVESVSDEMVVANLNHPLAGERLHFDVKVAEVREATAEELQKSQDHSGCTPEDCGCGGTSSD